MRVIRVALEQQVAETAGASCTTRIRRFKAGAQTKAGFALEPEQLELEIVHFLHYSMMIDGGGGGGGKQQSIPIIDIPHNLRPSQPSIHQSFSSGQSKDNGMEYSYPGNLIAGRCRPARKKVTVVGRKLRGCHTKSGLEKREESARFDWSRLPGMVGGDPRDHPASVLSVQLQSIALPCPLSITH
ncbi:hypothetical protein BO86DRAFT_228745 [Aspergillus japonicus CBS 114.51]|uniref:Uncharacterized protein n=1 Tax=Aspergillus japonicus CBS 114.51 TaxID=1448312 RepID=A0A8T8XBB6_ASPJA|nr:hypothetical protein BO86DRAFT_228745 [Aspergillus japonicus CBS 114.51]RAH84699.1 hypothetical protein BO86DRAFT_228745 [Aspergillus japonicus CBS 114.51]